MRNRDMFKSCYYIVLCCWGIIWLWFFYLVVDISGGVVEDVLVEDGKDIVVSMLVDGGVDFREVVGIDGDIWSCGSIVVSNGWRRLWRNYWLRFMSIVVEVGNIEDISSVVLGRVI